MRVEPTWMLPSTNDVRLAAYDFGGPPAAVGAPTLLISHATGLCAAMYRQLAQQLTGYIRVVALDYRAHGDSSGPANGDLAWGRMADDVHTLIAHLKDLGRLGPSGSGEIHGFGHSMGGAALMLAESRTPNTFQSLFLFEPIAFDSRNLPPTQNFMAMTARKRRAEFANRGEVLARFAPRPPFDTIRAGVLADYVDNGFAETTEGTVRLKCSPEHEGQTFEGAIDSYLDQYLGISIPVTVASGRIDGEGPNPARFAEPLAAALPNAEHAAYPDLTHFGPFEDPMRIAADIYTHIAQAALA